MSQCPKCGKLKTPVEVVYSGPLHYEICEACDALTTQPIKPAIVPEPEPVTPARKLLDHIVGLIASADYPDERTLRLAWKEIEDYMVESMGDQYAALTRVHLDAHADASQTKGRERHHDDGVPFEHQLSCWMERRGYDYTRGQAVKKIDESLRLDPERAIKELYGAMNLCAMTVIVLEEQIAREK